MAAQVSESASTFRVFQPPKAPVGLNEIIDLGTLKRGETSSHTFFLLKAGDGVVSGTVLGSALDVDIAVDDPFVQAQPSSVALQRGRPAPFELEIDARWLPVGTYQVDIGVHSRTDPAEQRPFRVQFTVLTGGTAEDAIEALYERYRRYTVGSGKSLAITLSQFQHYRRAALDTFGALDFITMPGGRTLDFKLNYLGQSVEGERIVNEPLWRDAGDPSRQRWWQLASTLSFLESIELDAGLEGQTRATRYRVQLSLGGETRTYHAVALWGGGQPMQVLDHITPQVTSVAGFETQAGLSSTLLDDTLAQLAGAAPPPWSEASPAGPPSGAPEKSGARKCEPDFNIYAGGSSFYSSDRTGHMSLSHGSTGWVNRTATCASDCRTWCRVNLTDVSCYERGDVEIGYHQVAIKTKEEEGFSETGPAHGAAAFHCAARSCSTANCGGFAVGISLGATAPGGGGGNLAFDFSHSPSGNSIIWDYEKQYPSKADTACPACQELFNVTVQVVGESSSTFQGDAEVKVEFVAGQESASEEFTTPVTLHNFGDFKEGESFGISYASIGEACLTCDFSNAPQSGRLTGPLNYRLTCRRGGAGLSAPGGDAEKSQGNVCGGNQYRVTVASSATALFAPPGADVDMPTVTATLSPPSPAQTMTINSTGSKSFANPIPDGTSFAVNFSDPGGPWSCTSQASGSVMGGAAVVNLSCFYAAPPDTDNCSYWPPACIAPPDCGYVWIHVGNLIVHQTRWVETDQGGFVDVYARRYPVYQRGIHCTSGLGASKNLGGDRAPLVLLRNSEESEFPGPTVPIEGVARDDASTVTRVEVFVNGQLVELDNFAVNEPDFLTCDEIPVLEPGRTCNFRSRFSGELDVSTFGPGTHEIAIYATNANGLVGHTQTVLNIAEPPPANSLTVTNQPDDAFLLAGEGTSWSVDVAGGVPPYFYTWEAKGPQATIFEPVGQCCNTSGSTTRTLVLHDAEPQFDGSQVRCRIEDSAGATVVSQTAVLGVGEPLQFAAEPEDVTVVAGQDATLSVDVFGGSPPYAYQWMASHPSTTSFVELVDHLDSSMTLESISSSLEGWAFLCKVTDASGEVMYSSAARLSVE